MWEQIVEPDAILTWVRSVVRNAAGAVGTFLGSGLVVEMIVSFFIHFQLAPQVTADPQRKIDLGPYPLCDVSSVAWDSKGNVFVADSFWNAVVVFDADGRFVRSFVVGMSRVGVLFVSGENELAVLSEPRQGGRDRRCIDYYDQKGVFLRRECPADAEQLAMRRSQRYFSHYHIHHRLIWPRIVIDDPRYLLHVEIQSPWYRGLFESPPFTGLFAAALLWWYRRRR